MTTNPVEPTIDTLEPLHGAEHHHAEHWSRFLLWSEDHKVVGIQYTVTSFFFFLLAGLLAMLIRAELITPDLNVVSRPLYNGLFTMHGTIMIFLWVVPAIAGIANYVIPLMIGARDMAFPFLNALAFWMIPPAGLILIISFFVPGGSAQGGWWSYPPLSTQSAVSQLLNGEFLWIVAVAILGVSSIIGAINLVTTIIWMRAPGMTLFRMPIFAWAVLTSQAMQLIFLPVLTADALMLMFDLSFGTHFFQPDAGGNPILYQHLFWFYSHPAVYIWALPVFGIFSEIIPAFTRNPLFGYRVVAIATFSFVLITGVVWVHHMFTSGTPSWMRIFFMFTTQLVAVPTGVKVFAWTATVWKSRLHLKTPMLFALGAVIMFIIAGITGVMLGALAFDLHVSQTYFVVGHFHYVVFNTITMGLFAAIYFWFPKMTGRMYSEGWGQLHFWLTMLGANLNFFPMFPLGLQGMLRRVSSYDPQYMGWNIAASLGSFLLGMATLPFIANMIASWLTGPPAPSNPWHATGLEWLVASPPPEENFEEIPTVTLPPYSYGDPSYSVRESREGLL